MEKRVLAALRSGREFRPEHVQALARQIARWAPAARLVVLSDVDVPGVERIPLKHDWPGWWVKMELFRPDIEGDFLVTDLDNVILGPIDDILGVTEYTNQRGQCNALAYYPAETRQKIWAAWRRNPAAHMHEFDPHNRPPKEANTFGDGGFIKVHVPAKQHWEDLFPGQIVNIATLNIRAPWPFHQMKPVPPETRVLLCHRPHRPWLLPLLRPLNLYA